MAKQTSQLTSSDRSMLKLQIVRTFPCRSLRGSLSKASRQVGGWDGSVTHTVTDSRFSRKGLNVNCSGSRLTGVTLPKHLVYTNKKGLKPIIKTEFSPWLTKSLSKPVKALINVSKDQTILINSQMMKDGAQCSLE